MKAGTHSNKGTEVSDVIWCPPSWLCKCGHRLDEHEGDTTDTISGFGIACVVKGDTWNEWADRCLKFIPEDNLSYVERVAKERNL